MALAEVDAPQFIVQSGITLGMVLAVVCSWSRNQSIFWAIIASFFSWAYVVYFALTRDATPPAVHP